jgi:hypothetical protein
MGGSFKLAVSLPASSTFCRNKGVAIMGKISQDLPCFGIFDYRSYRNFKNEIGSVSPGSLIALARPAVFSAVLSFILKMIQGPFSAGRHEYHIATFSAVSTVGASLWDKPLTSKTDTPRSTLSGLDKDGHLIDKLHAG